MRLPSACPAGLRTKSFLSGLRRGVARKRNVRSTIRTRSALRGPINETTEEDMAVIIGVDPHKATHTAVAIGGDERELGNIKVRPLDDPP